MNADPIDKADYRTDTNRLRNIFNTMRFVYCDHIDKANFDYINQLIPKNIFFLMIFH